MQAQVGAQAGQISIISSASIRLEICMQGLACPVNGDVASMQPLLDQWSISNRLSGSIWHAAVARILDVFDDLAEHAVLPLECLDLLCELGNLHRQHQTCQPLPAVAPMLPGYALTHEPDLTAHFAGSVLMYLDINMATKCSMPKECKCSAWASRHHRLLIALCRLLQIADIALLPLSGLLC